MIIDSHVHFWNYDAVKDAWITDDMDVIRRDFSPADVQTVFTENNVDGCVAIQADQSDTETKFLLTLAEENPFIKGVVGWVNLSAADISQQLEGYSGIAKLKGFRHISEGAADGSLLTDAFINGIKSLREYGYTYDILIRQHQLAEAIKLVNTVPNQPFIIDHCGKPDIKTDNLSGWKENITILAQNQNVYCKLSGLLTQCHWHNWAEADIYKCLDIVFENFGTGRILFGSDWPVMLLAGQYDQWIALIKKYTAQFSAAEQESIFGGNAVRFYNL